MWGLPYAIRLMKLNVAHVALCSIYEISILQVIMDYERMFVMNPFRRYTFLDGAGILEVLVSVVGSTARYVAARIINHRVGTIEI